ncbi:MAG: ABC transporter ATP-binding protein [Hyphomicrobiaceae bacterium]|nr:ABC transporter ATP-binding protein [Hyphomicrobiaceae bacterium]
MGENIILETVDLRKEFRGTVAVDGVSLSVREGTVHALIGPNGAGKTTLFNLITKFLQPTAGSIRYKGEDITHARAADLPQQGMVRSFQISAIFPHLTVLENVRVALQRVCGASFYIWKSDASTRHLNERAQELLEAVGLKDFIHRQAVELPYGRKRALEIATTLALEPEMLLLDEPMAGMTSKDIIRISELIRRIAEHRTIVMIEHKMKVVADLSDTITVLSRGRILAEGPYEGVSQNPDVIEAYMGTGHAA